MSLKPLNSVGGFSVGSSTLTTIIDANGNVTTSQLQVANGYANLGLVGNIYIGGGSEGQVLQTDGLGNLSWSSSANVNQIHNGNSNVTIPDLNGNVYINANAGYDWQWSFTTGGNLVIPSTQGTYLNSNELGAGQLTNGGDYFQLNYNDDQYLYLQDDGISINTVRNTGNDYRWWFDNNGLLTTPGNIDLGGNTINDLNSQGIQLFSTNYAQLNYNDSAWVYVESDGVWLDTGAGTLQLDATGNIIISNNLEVQGNIANANNISVTNSLAAGSANITNDLVVQGNIANANNISATNNITSNTANVNNNLYVGGNIAISNSSPTNGILTDNLYYSNGAAWDLQEAAGSNTQIQYNDGNNNFGASSAFTFDYAGNVLTVTGNAQFENVDGGNLVKANNFSTNGAGGDVTLTSGNVTGANVVLANSFTSNGGVVDFSTNNANVQLGSNANVHLYGGTSGQVLQTDGNGNLNWYSVSANGIQNGNSNVTITDPNGNVYINANAGVDQQWNFGTNGTLYFPVVNSQTFIQEQRYGMGNLVGYNDGGWVLGEYNGTDYGTEGIRISPGIEGNVEVILPSNANAATEPLQLNNYSIGNVRIQSNNYYWNFDSTGNTQFPSIGTANLGNLAVANYAQITSLANTQIPYANASNILVGSSGLTYDAPNQVLKVGAGGTELGGDSGYAYIQTKTGNFSGNINSLNANLGNLVTANYANFNNDLDVGGNIVTGTGSGGNISGVNYITANVANITDVVNTGKIANGTSNIRIDQNGNITLSSNNLSNVFTFNYQGANVVGYIEANGLVTAGGFVGANLVSNVGILTLQAQQGVTDYNINLYAGGNGNVDVNSTNITSVKDPVNPQDAATKYYVDLVAQGLHVHAPANLATATDLANTLGIPSGNVAYDNGISGVGATLTFTGNSLTTLDGNTVTANMRLLIKNEANGVWNGVYTIGTNAFFITRSVGEDTDGELNGGDFLFVTSGTQYGDTGWVQTTDNVVIGTSNIVWNQFSGAGAYYGANGILVSGTEITANVDHVTTDIIGGNIAVKDGAQLNYPNIGAATGTSLDLTGNVTAGNVTSNATITGVDASLTGNLEVGGNITTTGATGNISGANIVFANSFTSNGGTVDFNTNNANVQLGSNANVHLYGGSNGQVLVTNGSGDLTWTSTPNVSIIQNGTSNVTIPTADGNVTTNVNGNATLTVTDTGANITGYANISGNVTGANLVTGGNVYTENIVNITANTSIGMGNGSGIVAIYSAGNATQFAPSGQITLGGASKIVGGTFGGSGITLGGSQTDIFQNRGGNVTVQTGTGGTTANTWTFAQDGNLYTPGDIISNVVQANTSVVVGNSTVTYGNVTTNSITANQTIASFNATGVTGVEYIVKAIDDNGVLNKYSVSTLLAVTDGANVDFTIYGSADIGGYTGALLVNISGSNIELQVTPASSNSTVWTTQYRLI